MKGSVHDRIDHVFWYGSPQAMPPGNPGFDLPERDASGEATLWVEVKAITGGMKDRPVGLSSAQFRLALQHGEQYWLYVVEHAGRSLAS
jgi:hypothetical protein